MKKNELKSLIKKVVKEAEDFHTNNIVEKMKGCGKKEGKCCDGGDGRKCGTWTTMDDDCKCSYAGPCCSKQGGKKDPGSKRKLKETTITADNTKFNLRTGVNKNPTKLGIKIQFEPKGESLEGDAKSKLEVALQEKLNTSLAEYDIQVSKDTDVPRPEVIGFFIPLSQLKNLIVSALTGKKVAAPTVPAPAPPTQSTPPPPQSAPISDDDLSERLIKEHLLNEMRVRDLNEISKVVSKGDFYEFINKGNNILRTLEEAGINNGKKYLTYLVKHNIM